jgi:DNA-directed RNA polymerase specialized sigma24 family protein
MRKQLLAALAKQGLPPNDQEAMWLAYGNCHPFDVAAKTCGIPVGSFKVRIRRSRRILGGASTSP